MTVIERTEEVLANLNANTNHVAVLLAAMNNDPSAWEYDGSEPVDNGEGASMSINPPRCACGHPVRYQFVIRNIANPKQIINLGTTCINYLSDIDASMYADMVAAVKRQAEKLAALKRAAKAATQDAEIEKLAAEYKQIYDARIATYNAIRESGKRVVYNAWYALASSHRLPYSPPEYTRKASYIAWYKKHLPRIAGVSFTQSEKGE